MLVFSSLRTSNGQASQLRNSSICTSCTDWPGSSFLLRCLRHSTWAVSKAENIKTRFSKASEHHQAAIYLPKYIYFLHYIILYSTICLNCNIFSYHSIYIALFFLFLYYLKCIIYFYNYFPQIRYSAAKKIIFTTIVSILWVRQIKK